MEFGEIAEDKERRKPFDCPWISRSDTDTELARGGSSRHSAWRAAGFSGSKAAELGPGRYQSRWALRQQLDALLVPQLSQLAAAVVLPLVEPTAQPELGEWL